jgi:ABC-type metal ion transport system substrate-binding protein
MLFTQNLIQANFFIHTGMFLVNNKKKNKNYLLKIGDLVQKPTTVYFDTKKINRKWRKHI